MPTFATSQEWLHHSTLLLEARPSTTRVTTRYAISPARPRRPSSSKDEEQLPDAKPPRAKLVLKTYDPASGVCLKYRTTKAAEVSRLVQMLGSLGRRMAGLPAREEGGVGGTKAEEPAAEVGTPGVGAGGTGGAPPPQQQQQGGGGGGAGGGGKGKKKKGKR